MNQYSNPLGVLNSKFIRKNNIINGPSSLSSSLQSQTTAETVSISSSETCENRTTRRNDSSGFLIRRPTITGLKRKDTSIRERYLSKLGIRRNYSSPLDGDASATVEKHNYPSILSSSTKHQHNRQNKQNNHRNKRDSNTVQFNNEIKVILVPSRLSYSSRIRSRLWSDPIESHNNILRNTFEYHYEGRNWRNVIEESHMVDKTTHPIHAHVAHNCLKPKGAFLLYSNKMATANSLLHF